MGERIMGGSDQRCYVAVVGQGKSECIFSLREFAISIVEKTTRTCISQTCLFSTSQGPILFLSSVTQLVAKTYSMLDTLLKAGE